MDADRRPKGWAQEVPSQSRSKHKASLYAGGLYLYLMFRP